MTMLLKGVTCTGRENEQLFMASQAELQVTGREGLSVCVDTDVLGPEVSSRQEVPALFPALCRELALFVLSAPCSERDGPCEAALCECVGGEIPI